MRLATAVLSFSVLSALVAASAVPAAAQEAAGQEAASQAAAGIAGATRAAQAWLALMDEGRTADTWTQGAAFLRGAVTQSQWNEALRAVRVPLGAVKSRSLASTTLSRTLPGLPAGEYVVLEYRTDFANRAGAVETVTPMREADGSWKVAGYFIK
ncbi:DUF4019 domain-containing protein [Massilia consociata]|uniref:DUF4019 domain-containing protein n=1 Tax=Massilia consociata TaxID=760117 RepID=A0ABV6FAS0_9BURK